MLILRLLALMVVAAAAAFGQQSDASLSGSVSDATGAVIPGVAVTFTNARTGVHNSTISNESGIFISPPLQPGEYQVSAELDGFKKFVRAGVILNTGDKVSIKITLDVGGITDSLDVVGEAPILEYSTPSISRAITGSQVQQLPLINRDALSLDRKSVV